MTHAYGGHARFRTAGALARAADLAGIERLNQRDIEATVARDEKRLLDLWADDAVAYYPEVRLRSASRPLGLTVRNSNQRTRA